MTEGTKRVESECVAGRVRKLNRMVTAIYDGALASAGLKTSQFTLLVAVANRGLARPAELTKLLQLDESTLSRNVERMYAKGWLRLETGEEQQAQENVTKRLGAKTIAALKSAIRRLPG